MDRYYVVYFKDDPAKEAISVGYSVSGTIADAAEKTDRSRNDFEVQEIGFERYEKLRQFLS